MPVTIKANSGGGSVTLDAGTTSTDTTLTLPSTTGTLLVASGGVLAASGGGTGLSSPGTSGNVLTSNGTAWTSTAPAAGGVTSIVAGTGISVSGTTAITVNVVTTVGSVGTYAFLAGSSLSTAYVAGTTYAGSGLRYAGLIDYQTYLLSYNCAPIYYTGSHIDSSATAPSGTWRAMGTVSTSGSSGEATLFIRTV